MSASEEPNQASPAVPQASAGAAAAPPTTATSPTRKRSSNWRKKALISLGVAAIPVVLYFGWPELREILTTVSTDDAYVNGHVTFVAPRVSGQVLKDLENGLRDRLGVSQI